MEDVYMGIDVGSISTKGVIITKDNKIRSCPVSISGQKEIRSER